MRMRCTEQHVWEAIEWHGRGFPWCNITMLWTMWSAADAVNYILPMKRMCSLAPSERSNLNLKRCHKSTWGAKLAGFSLAHSTLDLITAYLHSPRSIPRPGYRWGCQHSAERPRRPSWPGPRVRHGRVSTYNHSEQSPTPGDPLTAKVTSSSSPGSRGAHGEVSAWLAGWLAGWRAGGKRLAVDASYLLHRNVSGALQRGRSGVFC